MLLLAQEIVLDTLPMPRNIGCLLLKAENEEQCLGSPGTNRNIVDEPVSFIMAYCNKSRNIQKRCL